MVGVGTARVGRRGGKPGRHSLVLCVLQEDHSRSAARTNNVVVTAISSLPRQATEIDAT